MDSVPVLQQTVLNSTFHKIDTWRKKRVVKNYLAIALVVVGPLLALTTTLLLGVFDGPANPQMLRSVLLADVVYTLVIATLVGRRILRIIAARRSRSAGSQLHIRLTAVFSVIALVPTVLVAVFATITLNFGLEGWFSERVQQVVGNSLSAAEAYQTEHRITLTSDAKFLADFIERQRARYGLVGAREMRDALSRGQASMQRGLAEAFVIDGGGELVARGERSYLFDYERPTDEEIKRALDGEFVLIEDWPNSEFRALVALNAYTDKLLYVTRDVDGDILNLLDDTRETVTLYQQLEQDRGGLLFEFALIYLGFAVVVILAAIWLGLWFAEKLSRPMGRLAGAVQRVGAGDLNVRVREEQGEDEIAMLGRVFNRMTAQLKGQRDNLVAINEKTERRRRLFDSVLSGVTAGIIGLDRAGRAEMFNDAAVHLLGLDNTTINGTPIGELVPEFATLFDKLKTQSGNLLKQQVQVTRDGIAETLLVRMAARKSKDGTIEGYVVTFDDVTDLVSAQRMAAWGDIARRIAHEIKNPLTPIQLSAERIKRKFGPMVGDESEALEQYAEVIVRQTNDLRHIVDEFSKFARMPAPQRKPVDVLELIRGAVLLQKSGRPDIEYTTDLPDGQIIANLDGTMITQAITNLVKNAGEAIDAKAAEHPDQPYQGKIRVSVEIKGNTVEILIQDNGIGLPQDRARLFEPYVTHRDEGTGLGLSIVKKIVEEHFGTLELRDAPTFDDCTHCGAEARICLAIPPVKQGQDNE